MKTRVRAIWIAMFMVLMTGHMNYNAYADSEHEDPVRPTVEAVTASNGNIVLSLDSGNAVQLTTGGLDCCPVLSLDRTRVAFVRGTPDRMAEDLGGEMVQATEIWIADVATNKSRLLVKGGEKGLRSLDSLQFSVDGKILYFTTPAWVVSRAVYVADVEGGSFKELTDGHGVEVVPIGPYQNCLIVAKHKYFVGGGSYDWYWLLEPNGNVIGPLGENPDYFKELWIERILEGDEEEGEKDQEKRIQRYLKGLLNIQEESPCM